MTPAQNVINKCGGASKTADLVGRSESWVYRWTYPKDRGGTGGNIPARAQRKLLEAAAQGIIDVSPSDFFEVAS